MTCTQQESVTQGVTYVSEQSCHLCVTTDSSVHVTVTGVLQCPHHVHYLQEWSGTLLTDGWRTTASRGRLETVTRNR